MKTGVICTLLISISVCIYAQDYSLCDEWLTDAADAFEKGDYKTALDYYNLVAEECTNNYSNCKARIQACKQALAPPSENGRVTLPNTKTVTKGIFSSDKTYLSFSQYGGNDHVKITSKTSWEIQEMPNWISVQRDHDHVIMICAPNYNYSAREGVVSLADANENKLRIVVFQDRNRDYLKLSANVIEEDGHGGTYLIQIKSNKSWHVSNFPWWCNIKTLPNDIEVTLSKNYSGHVREGKIEVEVAQSGGTTLRQVISVTQAAHFLVLSHVSFSDNTGRGSQSLPIGVETGSGDFSIEDVPAWCQIVNKTPTTFVVRILENKGGGARTAQLKVVAENQSKLFTVKQVARPFYINIIPSSIIVATKEGGYVIYHVETNCTGWHVVNLPEWCRVEEETNNSFKVTILPNDGTPRNTTFSVVTSGERINLKIEQD